MSLAQVGQRRTVMAAAGILAALAAAAIALHAAEEAPAPQQAWQPLFNGKDLEAWETKGTAIFKVEDGCLMGTQTDGKGGDIYTKASFDNFELRFTYRVGWPANSGVWFRGQYQFDILKWKNPVGFSGTLYCPGKMFLTTNLDESIEN